MTIDDVLQNAKRISIDDYFNIFDFKSLKSLSSFAFSS